MNQRQGGMEVVGIREKGGGGRLVMHLGFLLLKGTKPGEKC